MLERPVDGGLQVVAWSPAGRVQAERLGLVLGLLQAVARQLVLGPGLNHREGDVAGVAQDVVGALLPPPACPARDHEDTAGSECPLFGNRVRLVVPPRR